VLMIMNLHTFTPTDGFHQHIAQLDVTIRRVRLSYVSLRETFSRVQNDNSIKQILKLQSLRQPGLAV